MPADTAVAPADGSAAPAAQSTPAPASNAAPAPTATATPAANAAPSGAPPAAPAAGEAAKPAEAPAALDLKLPDQALLDATDLAEVQAFAKEHGLSQAQAQKLLERDNATVQTFIEDQKAMIAQQSKVWKDAVAADKDFGGANLAKHSELGRRFVDKIAGADAPEVNKILESTGLGNHPAVFRFLARAGLAIAEDNPAAGAPPAGAPKTFADALYGP